eukprot:687322-Pyramimonas_sp.AAC.1
MGPRNAGRMRPVPLEPSVELPVGPRSAVLGRESACKQCRWGFRWSSIWGHEALSWVELPVGTRNAVLGRGDANERRHFGGAP